MIELLRELPAELEWAVLFRLEPIARVVGDATARAAFGLPFAPWERGVSHVALTSAGPAIGSDGALETYQGAPLPAHGRRSLADRYKDLLSAVSPEVDCLGLGEAQPGSRVAMAVRLGPDGRGVAEAWFAERPSGRGWELLAAVGVRSLGEPRSLRPDGLWHARFSYSLEAHLQAARLGGFTRTLNCNEFFLSQGPAGARLQTGLRKAGRDRLTAAHATAYDDALAVAEAAGDTLMRARDARSAHDYGDLVPLGILLTGLRHLPDGPGALAKRGLNAAPTSAGVCAMGRSTAVGRSRPAASRPGSIPFLCCGACATTVRWTGSSVSMSPAAATPPIAPAFLARARWWPARAPATGAPRTWPPPRWCDACGPGGARGAHARLLVGSALCPPRRAVHRLPLAARLHARARPARRPLARGRPPA